MQEVRRSVKAAVRYAALASCACIALAACAISPPHRTAGAATVRPAPSQHVPARVACPAGHLLPHEGRVEIEWVDFLQFDSRQYIAGPGPAVTIRPSSSVQLSPTSSARWPPA